MAIAWAISICLIKYYDKTINYLKNNSKIDKWTYNKSLQKAIESYRITKDQKELLKNMKKILGSTNANSNKKEIKNKT